MKTLGTVLSELRQLVWLSEEELVELSKEPYERARERIQALFDRGVDPILHTLKRLKATEDAGKILGIYYAARDYAKKDKKWEQVMSAAEKKFRDMTGAKKVPAI